MTETSDNEFESLGLLLGAYLHIDWVDFYEDVWEAVDDFVNHERIADRLASEIDTLLALNPTEDELKTLVLAELGGGYVPDADGWSYRSWLMAVANKTRHRD